MGKLTIDYKVLPLEIQNDINRLVFQSFTANGKPVNNNYYKSEWSVINRIIRFSKSASKIDTKSTSNLNQSLFNAIVNPKRSVKVHFINSDKIMHLQFVKNKDVKSRSDNGIQNVYIKSPLAKAVLGKTIGDKTNIGTSNNKIEILDIK